MRSLSIEERKLLIIQGFDILAYSLANIFVTVFFFANSDLKTTTLYRIFTFASMTFFYGLSGWTLKRVSSGNLMKIGIVTGALFYFILFILKEKSMAFLIPLGILDGFSGGNYWAGYNINQYILTNKGKRLEYFGWGLAIVNSVSALGPIIGGGIITLVGQISSSITSGYAALFFLVFVILSGIISLIGRLPSHEAPKFQYHHILHHQRSFEWKLILTQQSLLGFYDMVISTVTGILLFLIVKGEFLLGTVTTVAAILATISSLISIKILNKQKNLFWVGSIGCALAIILFALYQHYFGMWLFIIISGLTTPILLNTLSVEFFHAVDRIHGSWKEKYHVLLERDILLGILRTFSYICLFIFLQFGDEIQLARIWLLFLPIIPLVLGFLLQKSIKIASIHSTEKIPLYN